MSAYACEPGIGSEPGAGWSWARAAARDNDVWLLTRRNNGPAIEARLREEPLPRLHIVYLDLPAWARFWKRGQRGAHVYYLLWQWLVARAARRLHRGVGFDVAHHLTFAVDWMPAGVDVLDDVPLVWGPVGGASGVPAPLWRWLGWRGAVHEGLREVVTRAARRVFGDRVARRSAMIIAQNHDVARRFKRHPVVVVEPNVALDAGASPEHTDGADRTRRALFVGRLVALKGARLAVSALARPGGDTWSLDIYGDGPEARSVATLARRLGVDHRVQLHGTHPRPVVLDELTRADALLFPSMHDAAGWAVAEALAVGCPVVCLDHAGPGTIVGDGQGVRVRPDRDIVNGLARGLAVVDTPIAAVTRWNADRLPGLLNGWYAIVSGRTPTVSRDARCRACNERTPAVADPDDAEIGDFEAVYCRACGTTSFVRPSSLSGNRYRELYEGAEDDGQFSAGLARFRLDLLAALPDILIPPPRLRTSDRVIVAAIRDRVPPGAIVLDIGCGSGRLVQALRRRGYRGVGAEVSERLVTALDQAGIPALLTDGGVIPWAGEPPAAVVLAEVLEHLEDPVRLLEQIRRQFPDALVLASVPSPERPSARSGRYESWDWPPNHLSRFTATGIAAIFRRAGLSEHVVIPRPQGTDLAPGWWQRSPNLMLRRLRRSRSLRSPHVVPTPTRAHRGPEAAGHEAGEERAAARRPAIALTLLWGQCAHERLGRALGSLKPERARPASASSMVVVGRPVRQSCL